MNILLAAIDTSIDSFINNIIKTYSIPPSEKKNILSIWNNNTNKNEIIEEKLSTKHILKCNKNEIIEEKLSTEHILKCNKTGLKGLCKKYNLKISGNKENLIKRLVDYINSSKQISSPNLKSKPKKILEKENNDIIQINRNQFGHYEHFETKLVFSKLDKRVIGKQHNDGTILELTKNDIELCNKFKFKYILPENLNKTDNDELNSLDSDLDDDIEEEIIEEEFTDEEYFSD